MNRMAKKEFKCPLCGSELNTTRMPYYYKKRMIVGHFNVYVCQNCNYFDWADKDKIRSACKAVGYFDNDL